LTRRAIALAFIGTFSSLGGLISGQIYHESQKPRYRFGNTVAFSCVLMQTIVAIILRLTFMIINRQRSQMNEKEIRRQIKRYGGSDLVGDRHPKFRYIL
jgi:hypothetical protein